MNRVRRPGGGGLLALKVWRDSLSFGSTSLSLVVLVAIGTALFVFFSQANLNLMATYHGFYDRYHLADATILVDRAPDSLVDTARLIPGVTDALGRAVKDGTIILRNRERRRVTGRFIGLPPTGRPTINDIKVVDGGYLTSRLDCLLEHQFAAENELRVGDSLIGSYLGRRREFRIVGLAASPEYLYPVPSKESMFASPAAFGVCWIDHAVAQEWLGLGRSITELHVLCEPAEVEQALVILKALGERYGLRSWWDQAGQPSNNLLMMDLQGLQALSVMFPILFMFAAGLSLYSSLTRIVRLQTGIVGFLRASGFSGRQVLWHYVWQGALVTGTGSIPGLIFGHLLSVWLTQLYVQELSLTDPVMRVYPSLMGAAMGLAMGVGWLAAWAPARAAAQTPPAIAMRGDAASGDANRIVPWLLALTRRVPVIYRISARGLVRRPSRTLFAVGGLVSGVSLLLSTLLMYTSAFGALNDYLYNSLQYELDVGFISVHGESLADAMMAIDGVEDVVKSCSTTARLRTPGREATISLTGLEAGQQLLDLRDGNDRRLDLRPGQIWLPTKTAAKLGVEAGDPIRVEWAYSSRERQVDTYLTVAGLYESSFGGGAYGEYQDLKRRLIVPVYPNGGYGAMIACPPSVGVAIRRRLERNDLVAVISSNADAKAEIEASMGVGFLFIGMLLAFGATLAGAVLHSVSAVGILERLRELATLRSLGFSARATAATAAAEMYLMATLSLIVGLPLGIGLSKLYLSLFSTDTASFPALTPPWTLLAVTLIVYGLVAFSMRSGLSRLRTMDLAQATKARE